MYLAIRDVRPLDDYLRLTFENGEKRQFDMKPYIDLGMFQELRDSSLFKTVRTSFDTIEWEMDNPDHADPPNPVKMIVLLS